MEISSDQLANEPVPYPLGERSRFFFESNAIDFGLAKQRAAEMPGVTVTDSTGSATCWQLTFTFEGHAFQIDSNHHAFCACFFVGDRLCSDQVLLRIVNEFATLPSYGPMNPEPRLSKADSPLVLLAVVVTIVGGVILLMLFRF